MANTISFTRDDTTEVTTNKNGYTEAQQRDYMIRTSTDLVKENRRVQEEELKSDANFVDSMRILYGKEEGADAETPPDEELVKWGLGYLADVNYNLVDLGEAAYDFTEATDLERMAMTYGLETYDAKDVTWDGVQRFASAFATDPTNLIGFGTLGAGFAAKFAGKGVAKQAFKKMLMNPANIAALEGAAFMGTEDVMRQDLEVDIGMKEEYDPMQTVGMATVGAVGGKVLGEGAEWLGKKLSKAPAEVVDEVQTIQDGLNDPQIKADFGPELLVGGISGIEQDEEGNVTFDPMKFMAGFLGGHVAKKIATNPRLNAKAKKEAMAYAQRMFDKLDANPKFDYLTGTMRAVENKGVKAIPEVAETIDKTTRNKNFQKWFEGSKVVDYNGEPEVVYHGTTHNIDEFSMDRASPENWHGKGFYFSDSVEDVNRNYGTMEGADLTNRIERRKEELEWNIGEENPTMPSEEVRAKAEEQAKAELSGGKPSVMPVYLDSKKPVIIDRYGTGTEFEIKMYDDEGEFLYEPEGSGAELLEALREEISRYDYDASDSIVNDLYQIFESDEGFTAHTFEDVLRQIEEFNYIEGDAGELIGHQIISDAYKSAGFDGIIMRNADEQFSNMGMNPDTTHYIVFEPNQIKSVNNKGAFSKDGNILKSAMIVPAVGAGAVATSQQDNEQ